MIRAAYSWLFRNLIRYSDPEMAHRVGLGLIAAAGRCSPSRALMRATIGHLNPPDPARAAHAGLVRIGERVVPGRVGLAAGMDKNAQAILGLSALGFAFLEVGTITPKAQPGNDAPRLWRLMESNGLRNRMGFNNAGAQAAADHLKKLRSSKAGRAAIVGANIGKNKVTSEQDAPKDYEYCARSLAPWADFVVVNVSSPNTPGLRKLQSLDHLRPILEAARRGCEAGVERRMPLFVKIAPDLSDEEICQIVELAKELDLAGVVATNTTINHEFGEGGVSGAPLRERALEVVSLVASHLRDDQILIGTGGVFGESDARAMLAAGADLVEVFTAFVFEGPSWPGEMNRALSKAHA